MTPRLTRIEAPHFVAGIVSDEDGIVVRTAPIVHYMRGWHVMKAWRYTSRKKWTCIVYMIEP